MLVSEEKGILNNALKLEVLTFLLLSEEPRIFSPDTQGPSKHQTKEIAVNVTQSAEEPTRKTRPQRQRGRRVGACFALALAWPEVTLPVQKLCS